MRSFVKLTVATALSIAAAFGGNEAQAGPLQDCGSGGSTIAYNYTNQMFSCTIVSGGTYSLWAVGGNGGNQRIDSDPPSVFGGKGAAIGATFALNVGDILQILIAGQGATQDPHFVAGETFAGGGGGGTFIGILRNNQPIAPLLIAGGGGGAGTTSKVLDGRGLEGSPGAGTGDGEYSDGGAGGTKGSGGGGTTTDTGGAGGGGFSGDGGGANTASGGRSFLNGGAGGVTNTQMQCFGAAGGFGGGGGAAWTDCTDAGGPGGGGGGGYSGGGGGGFEGFFGENGGAGGGGSSYYNPAFYVSDLIVQTGYNGYNPNSNGNGYLEIQQLTLGDGTPVPEPVSIVLLATALVGFGAARRRFGSLRP